MADPLFMLDMMGLIFYNKVLSTCGLLLVDKELVPGSYYRRELELPLNWSEVFEVFRFFGKIIDEDYSGEFCSIPACVGGFVAIYPYSCLYPV